MQVMPIFTRSSLYAHLDLPPDKFAKQSDTIYSYTKDTFQENLHLYAAHQSSSSSYARQPQPKQRDSSTDNIFQPFSPGQQHKNCSFRVYFANSAERCEPWCKLPWSKPKLPTNLKTVNGVRIKVHGKMTLTIAIPCLRRNYTSTFYIADVNDNILGLDFVKDKDININCRNLTVTDNVTKFTSTRNNSPAPPSHSPVLAVSVNLSQITDTALRKTMEQHSSISGDADFNTPCTHNTTHRIAVSTQPNFST